MSIPKDCAHPPQFVLGITRKNMSEDCLFVNVQAPAHLDSSSALAPVLLYIHGGSYLAGSGSKLYAQSLCTEG